ncbi:MAG: ROK family protein, partial [Bacteroidales bacterium]|nr:ROK family protein [Bacteroidales bacterium]
MVKRKVNKNDVKIQSNHYLVGIDIGGSHISCALVDTLSGKIISERNVEKINPQGSISDLLCICERLFAALPLFDSHTQKKYIGVAMPGPFDYKNGISKIAGVQKFDAIFGLNLKQSLLQMLDGRVADVVFENDATCFALGEYFSGAAKNSSRSLIITMGTGFGSTFLIDDHPQVKAGNTVPENGYLYNIPFGKSIANDYFSTSWFVEQWKTKTNKNIQGVKEIATLAMQYDATALSIFETFACNLAAFIFPWLVKFSPDVFVLGGNIAKAAPLYLNTLKNKLQEAGWDNSRITTCELWDDAPIIGAAIKAGKSIVVKNKMLRKTTQFLAPPKAVSTDKGRYDIYPAFPLGSGKIHEGSAPLAAWIAQWRTVVIDGYEGVLWNKLV